MEWDGGVGEMEGVREERERDSLNGQEVADGEMHAVFLLLNK